MKTIVKIIGLTIVVTGFTMGLDILAGNERLLVHYCWLLLANSLIIQVLYFVLSRHSQRGFKKRLISIWSVYFVIGYFSILIEAYLFNITDINLTMAGLIHGFIYTGIVATILIFIFDFKPPTEVTNILYTRTPVNWTIRLLAGSFIYFAFYALAGMLLYFIYPELGRFYKGKIPPFHVIAMVNLGIRGPLFVAIALLIDAQIWGTKKTKGIMLGLIFSVIGGIAPLITPNELMPQHIRIAHGFEVGISNFLYGLTLIYIVGKKQG